MIKTLPSFLAREDLQLILFGGKGGTGKTTAAAATALYLAKSRQNKKFLVISTDPAHSLEDSFCCPIGGQTTAVPGLGNLWALEIDAERLLAEFKDKHGPVIHTLAHRGTYFDEEDITGFFSLSLPGLDEVMAILKVADILGGGQFDVIILDTAPTGHTIRLLAQPEQMEKWVAVLNLMQEKHRYFSRHFTGRYVMDEADRFIDRMAKELGRVRSLLQDSNTTEFVPIAIPESLSIHKTERLLDALRKQQIPVKTLIVNRVAEEKDCAFCQSRSRESRRHVDEIEEKFDGYHIIKVPLFPHEIRGIENLEAFADALVGKATLEIPPAKEGPFAKGVGGDLSSLFDKPLEFILFGGKGGAGKTSLAAATGLYLAEKLPNKKILIFSTDPAHSLSDSFGCPIGDRVVSVSDQENLHALEIDAAQLLEEFKQNYRDDIKGLFDRFLAKGVEIKFDQQVMADLIGLAPPGLDEVMALGKIMELHQAGDYDLFILDTAPTGHLLRFLELPEIAKEWLEHLFRLLVKYRGVVRLVQTAERMLELSRNVRRIQQTLTDSQKTEFVAVALPEAMGVLETERLLQNLQRLKVPCRHVVINMVILSTECHFCAHQRVEQQRYLKWLERWETRGHEVIQVPMFPYEVKGLDSLKDMGLVLFSRGEKKLFQSSIS